MDTQECAFAQRHAFPEHYFDTNTYYTNKLVTGGKNLLPVLSLYHGWVNGQRRNIPTQDIAILDLFGCPINVRSGGNPPPTATMVSRLFVRRQMRRQFGYQV